MMDDPDGSTAVGRRSNSLDDPEMSEKEKRLEPRRVYFSAPSLEHGQFLDTVCRRPAQWSSDTGGVIRITFSR